MTERRLTSEFGSVTLRTPRAALVSLVVEGAPDANVASEVVRALERDLASSAPLRIEIDATQQTGAVPELRTALAGWVQQHRHAVGDVVVTAGTAQVELGYRRLSDELGDRVKVVRASASHDLACPPPVRAAMIDPRVMVVTTPPSLSDDEMRAFLRWHREWMATRREPYTLVLDLRRTERLSPGQREMITNGMDRSEQICLGTAMVFTSVVLRGVLTAIFWIRKPRYPTRVFGSLEEAERWARETARPASGSRQSAH